MGNNDDKKVLNINCVCDVVNFINELQDCATTSCPTGCDVPFLGAHQGSRLANTRPFVLFNGQGTAFGVYIATTGADTFSSILRVESVDECCAVLRALEVQNVPDGQNPISYFLSTPTATLQATNSVVTVDLNCYCAIQCLRDVHVSGV
ncbi:CotY/CotZ family spore coat protein [Bacillus sp. CGMCC 1.60114]|uniref:CotY/CotZ family spore coat protein n=1 Tax=unclassified Bacillus (in: firmicutes) TaxID=185979 RepID=UPI0036385E88